MLTVCACSWFAGPLHSALLIAYSTSIHAQYSSYVNNKVTSDYTYLAWNITSYFLLSVTYGYCGIQFKSLNRLVPEYLQHRFVYRNSQYSLRDSINRLALPLPRTNYLKNSFRYSGAVLWNSRIPRLI